MDGVTIVSHPLVQHKLTLLRKKDISTKSFRELLKEIGMLLCYEVTRDLPLADIEIDTPLAHMKSAQIAGKKLVFAPVLRAGVTFAEGMLDLVPTARIAHIGLYREPETFTAVEYFFKAPSDLHERLVIVISPVLATGNSAVAAVDRLKERGANDIRQVCLIGAPEGVDLGWDGVLRAQNGSLPGTPRSPLNDKETMASTAEELVRWYQQALRGAFFKKPQTLVEFKRISAMADAITMAVPPDTPAYGKGGSIDWEGFHCLAFSGQMIVSKVPVTFCLTINWNGPDDKVPAMMQSYIAGAADVLRTTAQAVG